MDHKFQNLFELLPVEWAKLSVTLKVLKMIKRNIKKKATLHEQIGKLSVEND